MKVEQELLKHPLYTLTKENDALALLLTGYEDESGYHIKENQYRKYVANEQMNDKIFL